MVAIAVAPAAAMTAALAASQALGSTSTGSALSERNNRAFRRVAASAEVKLSTDMRVTAFRFCVVGTCSRDAAGRRGRGPLIKL
ncbi:hypothetical protein GCM10010149_41990 [Nonomuraea roseoviolacea subsp. roseoviolacea]